MIVIPLGIILFFFALAILVIVAQWRVFEKAGQPGWASLIPIYNLYIMTKIAGKPSIWMLYFFIPFANIYFMVWLINMISKSFGKDEGFTAGLIFLGLFFWPILGFSRNIQYQGPYGDRAAFAAYQGKNKFDFEQPQQ
ncbi:MAG: DUF5684 domain-containing protein [Bacteroidetes bacterium]|nr:DUF5684 domain-containing protein [Bacteroidota bacterium]